MEWPRCLRYIRTMLEKIYMIPVLLYDSELFGKCNSRIKSRLTRTYNVITRYVYGLKRYESYCIAFSRQLNGVEFGDLLKIKTNYNR